MRLQRIPDLDRAELFFLALLPEPGPGTGPEFVWPHLDHSVSGLDVPGTATDDFWRKVLDLVLKHRLAGYVYRHHRGQPWWQKCPDKITETIQHYYIQTGIKNELYQRELVKALPLLATAGIVPVLLKGPALNLTVFDDSAERMYADIDLLVSPAELETACEVFRKLGFRIDENSETESYYRQHHFHLIFRHERKPWCCFEIHWDLATPTMHTRLQIEKMRQRARTEAVAGNRVKVLNAADCLLHLCLHASLNAFSILAQMRDIHALLSQPDFKIAPGRFWERARRYRVLNSAAFSIELARYFGTSSCLEQLRAARPTETLAEPMASMLSVENVVRQRLRNLAVGGIAVSLLRRDQLKDRLSFLRLQGLTRAMRIPVFLLLARQGWEIKPVKKSTSVLVADDELIKV